MRIQCVKCKNATELKFLDVIAYFVKEAVIACLRTVRNLLK